MRWLLWLMLLAGVSTHVQAASCRISANDGEFGSLTSFAVNTTVQNTTTALTLDCRDRPPAMRQSDYFKVKFDQGSDSVAGRAMLKNTANDDVIPLRMCTQPDCSGASEITIGSDYTWQLTQMLSLLSDRIFSPSLYFLTVPGRNVSAGTYQTILTLSIRYKICTRSSLLQCFFNETRGLLSVMVTLQVTNDCSTIAAPEINFGSAALVKNFSPVTQSIAITCTKGSVYNVGLSDGSYADSGGRNMANGTSRLRYDIFKGNTSGRWGVSGSERWSSVDSSSISSDGLLRTFNYTASILPEQDTPAAGHYSDTLVIDVAF